MNKSTRIKHLLMLMVMFALNFTELHAQQSVVTLNLKNATLKQVLQAIEKNTDYKFSYRNVNIDSQRNINVQKNKVALTTVLNEVLTTCGLEYKVISPNSIVISEVKQQQPSSKQKKKIVGNITDDSGEVIVGASIKIKDSSAGTVSDIDGHFSLMADEGDVLVVSYIGFKPQEITIGQQATYNIRLQDSNHTLNDIVVIGYGSVRKADLAGSVSVMSDKAFKEQPIKDVSEAFQGRVSGVNVVQSGVPGGNVMIRVRGTGSIHRSNEPLYVIDGIIRESGLQGISSEDIKSIQVLKDASSTAIYGSRGANGVVLIQTKQGRSGQQSVSFDASWSVANAYNMPKIMDTKTYAQALLDGGKVTSTSELQAYIDGTKPGISWMDEILRTGITQNYKAVVTKGNADTQYYISASYLNNQGVVQKTKFDRYQAKMNIHSRLFKWLETTAELQYVHSKGTGAEFSMSQQNPLWIAQNYSPTMEMYDSQGKYNKDPYNSIQSNPLGMLEANKSERRHDIINGRIDFKFNILPTLTFTTTNGIDYIDHKTYSFTTANVFPTSGMGNGDVQTLSLQTTNNLTYQNNWNKHGLTATLVYEASQSTTRNMSIGGTDLQTESVGWWDVSNANKRTQSNAYSKWALLSGVARVMYSFDDKYMLTGTFRADGSSRFSENKWGYFPSIATAWTISNEKFMKPIHWINNLKVRASYGLIGNQSIPVYATLGMLARTSFDFGTTSQYTGYWTADIATPDLTWEKTKQLDLGLDIHLWDSRVEISIDYFNKKTTDALLLKTFPAYLGGTAYWVNAGEISNKGVDLSVTARILQTKVLTWNSTINTSYLKNKVVKLTTEEPIIEGSNPAQGTVQAATIVKEGEAIGTFYGYRWAGLNANGLDSYYDKDGNITTSPQSHDRVVLGHANPNFTLGWNNSITYKNWEVNAFFNSAFGAKRLNLVRFAMNSMVGASKFVTDASYIEEINKTMPALNAIGNNNLGNSSKWLENANYLRCENLSIAYNIPKQKTGFADIRLALSVQNLFTLTSYKGADPAGMSFSTQNTDLNNGIDMGTYPNPRTFTFNVRFNF